MLNPFKYFAEQRKQERELLLTALRDVLASNDKSADIVLAQTQALKSFLDRFLIVDGPPIRRVMTDEMEYDIEQAALDPVRFHGES